MASIVIPRIQVDIFLVSGGFYLDIDFEVTIRPFGAAATVSYGNVNEHLPGTRGDYAGNGKGKRPSLLKRR